MSRTIIESGNPDAGTVSLLEAVAGDADLTQGRDPSPDIDVSDFEMFRMNQRTEIIDSLDEAFPDFKHCYADPRWGKNELEKRKLELVEGEMHFNDPVARMPREGYDRRREVERAYSAQTVERVVDPENDIYQTENMKAPHRQRRRMA